MDYKVFATDKLGQIFLVGLEFAVDHRLWQATLPCFNSSLVTI
jgi:hypothetical protein